MEILKCLKFGSATRKYNPIVRRFCFTMHFYSPKAYDYIRETFDKHLPAARTLRSWYSSLDGCAGFTEASFDALKQRADTEKKSGKQLLVGLMLDGMFIRQHSQWDRNSKSFLGHNTTRDATEESICLPLATNALVLMVSGVENNFKLPIAYFLNDGSKCAEISDSLNEAMYRLHEAGCILISITYDGAAENIAAAKFLGSSMENTFIINPFDTENEKVYMILGPPHMLKLIRNCLGNKRNSN